ncbi:MAG: sensor histidine kinase [Firmicutes bacterium HGW-Firmicutes-2]|jgi:signal transduction histidine kinase|nr:MAG: sensor histidine kinase [Firmicutes bacterium HGW-Firmicutes-2]
MKYATRLLLNYLFFSVLSFAIIIVSVDKAIDYFSFVTIEKQMMEKVDLSELLFREVLSKQDRLTEQGLTSDVSKNALEVLKASGKEVRIYDHNLNLIGLAVNGISIDNGTPRIYKENIENALKGDYSYTVTKDKLIYFAIPIQDKYYQNIYVFELVENISYFYDIMDQIRYILFVGAGGFIILITLSSLYIARKTTKPIQYLLDATERFSKQQFEPIQLKRKDELGMLAAGLNRMGIQLNDYIQYQKQFVSNVSHELKTPLAAIRGFSQYLYEEENEDEDLQKIYFHLVNESERLTILINELLMLSRFDKIDQEELSMEKTDVSELTQIVILEMMPKADKNEITLEVSLDQSVYVRVNKILMSHAIGNILDNAIKYSNPKGHIKIEVFAQQMEAVLAISDEGIGVDERDISHVQERFYRAKNSNTIKGSGLGLSICKEIIEKFNGELVFESEIEVGTTVSLILPLV